MVHVSEVERCCPLLQLHDVREAMGYFRCPWRRARTDLGMEDWAEQPEERKSMGGI